MKIEKKIETGKKLQEIRQKALVGIDTGSPLTTPQVLSEILSANYLEGTLYDLTTKFQISPDHNSCKVPIANQVSRTVKGGIVGGVISYPCAEDGTITASFPKFTSDTLVLNKIATLIRVSDEVARDAVQLSSFLHDQLTNAIRYYVDHYIIYGNGNVVDYDDEGNIIGPTCNGIANTGNRSTKFVSLSSSFTLAELKNMTSYYYGNPRGIWAMAHDSWADVLALVYASSSYNAITYQNINGKVTPYLFGFEVKTLDCMNSKDIILGDFSAYTTVMIDPKTDISSDVYFTTAEQCYRQILRINGIPSWIGPITEQSGDVNYPFVMNLGADQGSSLSTSVQDLSTNSSSSRSTSSMSSSSTSTESSTSSGSTSSATSSTSKSSKSSASESSTSSESSSTENAVWKVTGTNSPNAKGFYYLTGLYNGENYFRRKDGAMYLWYKLSDTKYYISGTLGGGVAYFVNGVTTDVGGTYTAAGTATGTATVAGA